MKQKEYVAKRQTEDVVLSKVMMREYRKQCKKTKTGTEREKKGGNKRIKALSQTRNRKEKNGNDASPNTTAKCVSTAAFACKSGQGAEMEEST